MNKLTKFLIASTALLALLGGCAASDPAAEGDSAAAKEANSKPIQKSTSNGMEKPSLEAPSAKLDGK